MDYNSDYQVWMILRRKNGGREQGGNYRGAKRDKLVPTKRKKKEKHQQPQEKANPN